MEETNNLENLFSALEFKIIDHLSEPKPGLVELKKYGNLSIKKSKILFQSFDGKIQLEKALKRSSIRPTARSWFKTRNSDDTNKIYISKFYNTEKSWPKVALWWVRIPSSALDINNYDFVNLLCQCSKNFEKFHFLIRTQKNFIN